MLEWFPDWNQDIAIVVASGPSAKEANLELFKDKAKFIVVNDSWKLAPWADFLFAADGRWWQMNKGVPAFVGKKVTLDALISREMSIKLVRLDKLSPGIATGKKGLVGMGQNSGFYALNLTVQFGAKKILLVGFDMNIDNGIHWHGSHDKGLTNPNPHRLKVWAKLLDSQAKIFQKLGIEIINASQKSSLTAYPKMTVEEVFGYWLTTSVKPQERIDCNVHL